MYIISLVCLPLVLCLFSMYWKKVNVRLLSVFTLNAMLFSFIINLNWIFLQSFNVNQFESLNSKIVEFLNLANSYYNISLQYFSGDSKQIFDASEMLRSNYIFFTLDKVSVLFLLLTTILVPFALLSNWNSIVIFNSKKLFYSLLIWIELMLIITFTTNNLFMFYLGFEGLSIPVFFLIFLYGAEITKLRASVYFLIYSFISSTFMAVSIFLLFHQTQTLDINKLVNYFSNNTYRYTKVVYNDKEMSELERHGFTDSTVSVNVSDIDEYIKNRNAPFTDKFYSNFAEIINNLSDNTKSYIHNALNDVFRYNSTETSRKLYEIPRKLSETIWESIKDRCNNPNFSLPTIDYSIWSREDVEWKMHYNFIMDYMSIKQFNNLDRDTQEYLTLFYPVFGNGTSTVHKYYQKLKEIKASTNSPKSSKNQFTKADFHSLLDMKFQAKAREQEQFYVEYRDNLLAISPRYESLFDLNAFNSESVLNSLNETDTSESYKQKRVYSEIFTDDVLSSLRWLKESSPADYDFSNCSLVFDQTTPPPTSLYSILSLERLNLIWLLLFLAFIIKLPLVPFHMWLPEAHAEAPTSGSILLTGLILKLGGYGLLKFFIPILGGYQYFLPLLHTLCVIGIIYICLVCLKTNHIKQIIAYSSIVHMNGVCLGLFTNKIISVTGSVYAMLSHSLISSSLFFLAGTLYNRYGSYYIENYSGVFYNMPYFSFYFILIILANIATPLTSGFVAELLILIDLSKNNLFIFLIFSTNYILNTAYSIWLLNRVLFGDIKINKNHNKSWGNFLDLNIIEISSLQLFLFLIMLFGILPNLVLNIV